MGAVSVALGLEALRKSRQAEQESKRSMSLDEDFSKEPKPPQGLSRESGVYDSEPTFPSDQGRFFGSPAEFELLQRRDADISFMDNLLDFDDHHYLLLLLFLTAFFVIVPIIANIIQLGVINRLLVMQDIRQSLLKLQVEISRYLKRSGFSIFIGLVSSCFIELLRGRLIEDDYDLSFLELLGVVLFVFVLLYSLTIAVRKLWRKG